jgi:hypothetical protein
MREYGDRGPVGPRTARSRNQVVIPNPVLSELAICDGLFHLPIVTAIPITPAQRRKPSVTNRL